MNVREIAKKSVTFAEIMEDREKVETEELIKMDRFSIDEVEFITMQKKDKDGEDVVDQFWAFHCEELPDKFAFAGLVLGKIFNDLLAECSGDFDELNAALKKTPLVVSLGTAKTKNKMTVTTVEVL